jgi:hypothetical protein
VHDRGKLHLTSLSWYTSNSTWTDTRVELKGRPGWRGQAQQAEGSAVLPPVSTTCGVMVSSLATRRGRPPLANSAVIRPLLFLGERFTIGAPASEQSCGPHPCSQPRTGVVGAKGRCAAEQGARLGQRLAPSPACSSGHASLAPLLTFLGALQDHHRWREARRWLVPSVGRPVVVTPEYPSASHAR